MPRTVTFADGKTITWIYDATGRKLQKRTCELRSGTTPIVISDVKRPDYIDERRHQSERIKHISTNRTPAEATLDIIDYYVATNIKIQTAIQQTYIQTGTPPIRTNPPVVEPDRESCNIRDYVLGLEYLNEEKEGYYHEEGRINLLEGGRVEYTLKDHLGNGRVFCYYDANLHQAKTIQEAHYYPFGLPIQKLSPNFEASVGVEANNYQYNGIELVEDFGYTSIMRLFEHLTHK
ncbi:MAG: hypothetical protein IPM47_20435 [Sphingobacteriales bacterium]|nr:MAG: hypothetical protein IPM47_20435 [Sphingobacteriales bacterium]